MLLVLTYFSSSKYVGQVCRHLKVAFPQLEGIRFREFTIRDETPSHEEIAISKDILTDALDNKELGWRWSRYGVDATWDFGYVV